MRIKIMRNKSVRKRQTTPLQKKWNDLHFLQNGEILHIQPSYEMQLNLISDPENINQNHHTRSLPKFQIGKFLQSDKIQS